MRISDWSSDVCSSDLRSYGCRAQAARSPECREPAGANRTHRLPSSPSFVLDRLDNHKRLRPGMIVGQREEIGRASWREGGCQYGERSVLGETLKQKN